jgi:prepilin-type processing-associated H-X9-DG protein
MRELVRKYEEVDPEFYYCPLNFPYEMSPDWITEPGTPGLGWGGWSTDETSINIGYDWFINFSVPSGYPDMQFFNGFRITKTISQAREDIAVACDSLRVHQATGPATNHDQDLYNWEFRKQYDLPGEYTGAWYVWGVWQGHQWSAGGINVLYGDGHVEFNQWNSSNMKARALISGGVFYN